MPKFGMEMKEALEVKVKEHEELAAADGEGVDSSKGESEEWDDEFRELVGAIMDAHRSGKMNTFSQV